MFTIKFWADTSERAVSTGAQAALSVLTVGITGLLDINVAAVLSVVGLAMLLAVLKALAARGIGDSDSASLAPVTEPAEAEPVAVAAGEDDEPGEHAAPEG